MQFTKVDLVVQNVIVGAIHLYTSEGRAFIIVGVSVSCRTSLLDPLDCRQDDRDPCGVGRHTLWGIAGRWDSHTVPVNTSTAISAHSSIRIARVGICSNAMV